MVGSTGTLMSIRLVRNKFRKREEISDVSLETPHQNSTICDRQTTSRSLGKHNSADIYKEDSQADQIIYNVGNGSSHTNNWVFPPKEPTPIVYGYLSDTFINSEKNALRGFRKQFSGRFKRLVSKKSESSTIPPELKPQLKTIYVY